MYAVLNNMRWALLISMLILLMACGGRSVSAEEFINDVMKTCSIEGFDYDGRLSMVREDQPVGYVYSKEIKALVNGDADSKYDIYIGVELIAKKTDLHPNKFKIIVDDRDEFELQLYIFDSIGKFGENVEALCKIPIKKLESAKKISISLNGKHNTMFDENDIRRFTQKYQKQLTKAPPKDLYFKAYISKIPRQ